MTGKTSFAQGQLRALVERIERLEEEKAAIAADIKEIYAEAKANGFDTKILRKVVSLRKKDAQERAEEDAMLDVYLAGLGMQASLFDETSSTAVDEAASEESGSGVHTATGAPAAPIASSDTERASTGAGKPLTDETPDAGSVSAGYIAAKSDDLAEIQPRPVPESAADMVEGAVIPVSVPSTDYSDMEDIPAFLDRRKGSGNTTGKATPTSGVISGLSCLPAHDAGVVS